MDPSTLLLNAYYERLFELVETNRLSILAEIEKLLPAEAFKITADLNNENLSALKDVCLALVEERIEMYNPIGIQYTFDRLRTEQARQLELQLDWFDSRQEFEELITAVRTKAQEGMTSQQLQKLTNELIDEFGAFPDKSIIDAFRQGPSLNKVPDYIVSVAIEEIVR
ncbi:MAG: hypothetical protein ACYSUK_07555 [Planctomycetota bacterium]|jgi:hypothetical protein